MVVMIKKLLVVILCVGVWPGVVFCQGLLATPVFAVQADSTTPASGNGVQYRNNIGAAAGFISGYGISYRRVLTKDNYLQITGFPYYHENGMYASGTLSLGVGLDHVMARERIFAILSYFGGNYNLDYRSDVMYSHDMYYNYYSQGQRAYYENKVTLGCGIGAEATLWRFLLNLKLGIRGYYSIESKEKGLMPSIEVAAYFGY